MPKRKPSETVFYLLPHPGTGAKLGWRLTEEDSWDKLLLRRYRFTDKGAVREAERVARSRAPSRLVVSDRRGRPESERRFDAR